MANKTNELSHSKWVCKYHIVFTPKYRRKIIYCRAYEYVGAQGQEAGTAAHQAKC